MINSNPLDKASEASTPHSPSTPTSSGINVEPGPLQINAANAPSPVDTELEETTASSEEIEEEDSEEEEDTAQQKDIPQTTSGLRVHTVTVAKSSPKRSTRDDEPYEWGQCTIVLTIQLLPLRSGEDPQQRRVVVAAQSHSDPPVYKLLTLTELGALPQPAVDALDALRAELPVQAARRKAAESDREHITQAKNPAHSKGANGRGDNKAQVRSTSKGESAQQGTPAVVKSPAQGKSTKKKKFDLNALPELPGFGAPVDVTSSLESAPPSFASGSSDGAAPATTSEPEAPAGAGQV